MNIYVGNLSHGVTDGELNAVFSEFGEVSSAKVIMDKHSGRSRGYGFVEMSNDSEALWIKDCEPYVQNIIEQADIQKMFTIDLIS